jgi:hypothetical protein
MGLVQLKTQAAHLNDVLSIVHDEARALGNLAEDVIVNELYDPDYRKRLAEELKVKLEAAQGDTDKLSRDDCLTVAVTWLILALEKQVTQGVQN